MVRLVGVFKVPEPSNIDQIPVVAPPDTAPVKFTVVSALHNVVSGPASTITLLRNEER